MRTVESLTGSVCLRNLSNQSHVLSALFVTDVCIDSQLLKFHTRKYKHKKLINKKFHFIPLHDNSFYICYTCAQKLDKN